MVDKIYVVCPTWESQTTFDPMRHLVDPKDVYLTADKDTFTSLFRKIKLEQNLCLKKREPKKDILILIDDMSGSEAIHGGRRSPFGNLAIQTPHWNVSMMVLTQQPTTVSPSFRDNVENIFVFPSEGTLEVDWLKRCWTSLLMTKGKMEKIILEAWRGGRNDNSEWGKHFLFIQATPRRHSRFWIDLEKEIKVIKDE